MEKCVSSEVRLNFLFLLSVLTKGLGSLHEFFCDTASLLEAILVLVKATQGGDTRGSEIVSQTIVNTQGAPRSLYAMSGYLALVSLYSKTRHNTSRDELVARFP